MNYLFCLTHLDKFKGTAAENHLGKSVSNAADVSGDGFDDIIVGRTIRFSSIVTQSGPLIEFSPVDVPITIVP